MQSKDRKTDLVYLHESRFYSVSRFECIGSGFSTARYFADWLYAPSLPVRVMGPLTIQILKSAKMHNVGCEGETKVCALLNDSISSQGYLMPSVISDARFLWGLHEGLKTIVVQCMNSDVNDIAFSASLDRFSKRARMIRGYHHTVVNSRATLNLQVTTDDPRTPQPSQK
jgi:hypothetical protein